MTGELHPPHRPAASERGEPATVRDVMRILKSLNLGRLQRVDEELERAGRALDSLGQEELHGRLEQARSSLRAGQLREFRRALATVTARLGHLK